MDTRRHENEQPANPESISGHHQVSCSFSLREVLLMTSNLSLMREWKEQDGWMLNLSLKQLQAHTKRATETSDLLKQDSTSQTSEFFKCRKKQSLSPCHAVIGARPYCSPEYSTDFHKLGSTLPCSNYRTMSHIKADSFIPLQFSTRTRVPYSEKRRLLDKQVEIQEVKQLDEWKPAVGIFPALLKGLQLDGKAS